MDLLRSMLSPMKEDLKQTVSPTPRIDYKSIKKHLDALEDYIATIKSPLETSTMKTIDPNHGKRVRIVLWFPVSTGEESSWCSVYGFESCFFIFS